jgi:N-acetylglucosamine kinase-like BadF-type ATPase
MSYILAIDGGGTKTHLAIFDTKGTCIHQHVGPGSNHQSSDSEHVRSILSSLIQTVLKACNLTEHDIVFCHLGLSGADLPEDFLLLNTVCKDVLGSIPFQVDNDAWLVLRSGLKTPVGAVCIAGTGTNAAAVNPDGKKAILRSLGFTLGIYGGGLDIAREALHYAFRADELTYQDTLLRTEIPKLLGQKDMASVVPLFYPKLAINRIKFGEITALVNTCANQKDIVSMEILKRIGKILGDQTAGVIRQVQMTEASIPVVVGGRVFDGECPLLYQTFKRQLKKNIPKASFVKPVYPPVVGAYLLALDHLGIPQTESLMKRLQESWSIHEKNT